LTAALQGWAVQNVAFVIAIRNGAGSVRALSDRRPILPNALTAAWTVETEISRERATEIGGAELASRGVGEGAYGALAFHEVYRPPRVPGIDLERCWFVYAKLKQGGPASSTVVVIARRGGAVLFTGSADDGW
jgi:hypothetical protein